MSGGPRPNQVQGRFKQLPRGVLYLGGEVLEPTKLGVVTKGLANVLLKFLTLWANSRRLSLHCCLDDKGGGQLAHVTMPLWCAADRIVATPAGCAPPQLGTELPEADEAVLARRASCETGTWQLGSTYSFSFHNAHFDMPTWRAAPSLARCCPPCTSAAPPRHPRCTPAAPPRHLRCTLRTYCQAAALRTRGRSSAYSGAWSTLTHCLALFQT